MKALRKPLSLFMALLMCLGVFVGTGTTAFAAGETMTTYMIDLPRANDPNKAGWGHPALNFLGGWSTGENDSFSVHTQDAFNGRAIYCIEPGVGVNTGDQYTGRGEDFWDNYPSNLNPHHPAGYHQGIYRADHDLWLAGQRQHLMDEWEPGGRQQDRRIYRYPASCLGNRRG